MDEQSTDLDQRIDRVLNKYVAVWLWSILFGSASAVAYTLVIFRPRDGWGPLTPVILALLVLSGLATLVALWFLYRYFVRFLIPIFFSGAPPTHEVPRGAPPLRAAVLCLFFALACRFLIALSQSVAEYLEYRSGS